LQNRCVSLKRYPDEAGGEFFWEKDAPAFTPKWVRTHAVWRRSGQSQIHYIVIDDVRTLAWAATISTLEFHPFLSQVDDVSRPTSVVFDLDPGEPAGILDCARVALRLRDLLARLSLQAFVKVSGSKGIQVYVPLNTPAPYADTQAFARAIAVYLARQWPDQVVSEMERRQRRGKVFVDWSQNADYKTTVSVYSLRAKRRHPYISMPVRWEELESAIEQNDGASLYFLPDWALQRLRESGDLFAPVLTLEQELPQAFESSMIQRTMAERRASPKPHTGGKLLNMPAASSQGGRRLFSLVESAPRQRAELRLQLPSGVRRWQLARGLPRRQEQSVLAREIPAGPESRHAAAAQEGTFELIEGSVGKGYLDLFLTTDDFQGEWLLSLNAEDGSEWTIRRPAKQESGLTFDMQRGVVSVNNSAPEPGKPVTAVENESRAEVIQWKTDMPISLEHLPEARPAFAVPMECRLVSEVPNGAAWLYEIKLDGYRAVAVNQTKVQLLSRYGRSFNARFPQIVKALEDMQLPPCVLDGEVVALDPQGRPNFQELQNSRSTRQPIVYYVFDVLNYDGRDLKGVPLAERRKLLDAMAGDFRDPIRVAAALESSATEIVSQVKRFGLEGIVAKRRDSIYESGKRPGSWVKYRINRREEFIIGGYRRSGSLFDAILVGRFEDDQLKFIEKIKNGFVPATRKQVFDALQDLIIGRCPFANLPERAKRRAAVDAEEMKNCVWVRPVQQCEVDLVEWTRGGHLRHSAFRQLTDRISGPKARVTPKRAV
jgi:bifunctional non-homologous end joining protein LigD